MNKLIQEQLNKCINADLTHYDETNHEYFIPQRKDIKISVNNQYLIHLLDQAKDVNNVVNTNWNKSQAPKDDYYKIDVEKVMGKMIFVNSIVYDNINEVDTDILWSGWLHKDYLEVIEQL